MITEATVPYKITGPAMVKILAPIPQHLIADEAAGADSVEQRYYQDLLEQNENQSLLIQKKIDRMYFHNTFTVT